MEALAAVGLASNVLQFVEFATKIVRTSNELRQDATSSENRDHAAVAAHLRDLAQNMLDESHAAAQTTAVPSPEEKAYQAVLDGCSDLAKQLLKRMEECGVNQGQPTGLIHRTRRAFKCVWDKQEINDINTRLQNFRGEINAYCIYRIRKTQLEDRVNQPCKADLESVVAQVAQLGASVEGLSLQQSSFGTDLDSSQRTTLEALSSLKSDNMQLVTGVNQATSTLLGQKMLLQAALQEALGEFRKEMLPLVKYEFHSAGEAELAKAQDLMLHEIRGMLFEQMTQGRQSDDNHASSAESQQSCDTTINASASIGEDMAFSSKDRVLPDYDLLANRGPERTHESTTIVIYDTIWEKITAFARFQVRSRHTVSFDQQFRATETYEITARVLPTSRCWFATGCEINFKRVIDVRGVLSWTWKQPQTYRVLDIEDKVFQCIESDDIDTVRTMLSNKTMFPSDRDHSGHTPLHWAAAGGNVEICRSLLKCGADPHAQDSAGYIPVLYTLVYCAGRRSSLLDFGICLGQVQQLSDIPGLVLRLTVMAFLCIRSFSYDTRSSERLIYDWVSSFRIVGIDLQECDDVETQRELFFHWGLWSKESGGLLRPVLHLDGQDTRPPAVVNQVLRGAVAFVNSLTTITSNGNERGTSTNIGIAAFWLARNLREASESGALHRSAGDGHGFAYRGFFVDQCLWATLKFLDTVISNDIDAHPDSIFDTYDGLTICDWFWDYYVDEVWDDILEEHGFDPDWAWEENWRRKNLACANATGHDAEVETPASQALEVKKRRTYVVDDDG